MPGGQAPPGVPTAAGAVPLGRIARPPGKNNSTGAVMALAGPTGGQAHASASALPGQLVSG